MAEEPRPSFSLIDPRALTPDAIRHMYRELTGKDATDDEMAEAMAELEDGTPGAEPPHKRESWFAFQKV